MFDRDHHRRIAQILSVIDAEYLRERHCWFGGGTAMVLRYGEYRESLDIDFMVSDRDGYRNLREDLSGPNGILALMRPHQKVVQQRRDVRCDQYGIRTFVAVGEESIKLEIVFEARITFDAPSTTDVVAGITTLTRGDLLASKLLANCDRWADDGTFSRDILDVALTQPDEQLLAAAIRKAEGAYGGAIRRDLASAIDRLKNREGRLERCIDKLQITQPKAVVWKLLRELERHAGYRHHADDVVDRNRK